MLFSMAACGTKTETPAVTDTREGFENLQLSLGDGLPSITMWGTYYLNDINDDYAADGMVASYYTDLESEPDYDFYQWEKGEKTLEEIVVQPISKRGGIDKVLDVYKFDEFEGAGYENIFFVGMNVYNEKNYLVQSYYFEAEEYYLCMDRWVATSTIETGAQGLTIDLPVIYKEAGYTDQTPKTLKCAYYDSSEQFPLVYVYQWDEAMTYDEVIAKISADYNITNSSKMTFTGADGKQYDGGFVRYEEQSEGQTYDEREYFILKDGAVVLFNFLTIGDHPEIKTMVPTLFKSVK